MSEFKDGDRVRLVDPFAWKTPFNRLAKAGRVGIVNLHRLEPSGRTAIGVRFVPLRKGAKDHYLSDVRPNDLARAE